MRAAAFVFLLMPTSVWAIGCDTNLKSDDTYKELSAKLKCLNDRISALEGGGGSTQKVAMAPKPVPGTQVQEGGGLKMEIESCAKSGANLSCRLFVTAGSGDQEATFQSDSKAVDSSGTVFRWKGLQTAGQQMGTSDVQRSFIGDVRTGSTVFFEGGDISPESPLAALQLSLYTQGKHYTVTFRNLLVK